MSKGYGSINVVNASNEEDIEQRDALLDAEESSSSSRLTSGRQQPRWIWMAAVSGFLAIVVLMKGSLTLTPARLAADADQGHSHSHAHMHKEHHHYVYDDDELYDPEHYPPRWFKQPLDHFNDNITDTWEQRYFTKDKYFGGPGHPIFMVMSGEAKALGMFYPIIDERFAKKFKAYTLIPEHRFYGKSQPVKVKHNKDLVGLLTPDQAIMDAINLLTYHKKKLGCSFDKTSKDYCPVITVGGSYPGFLALMLRVTQPDHVDIAYAASSVSKLYAQDAPKYGFFDRVTEVAEASNAGCKDAVKAALTEVKENILSGEESVEQLAKKMKICHDKKRWPKYIDSIEMFERELMFTIVASFAEMNMGFYPPSPKNPLPRGCQIFKEAGLNSFEKVAGFLELVQAQPDPDHPNDKLDKYECFDFHGLMSDGENSTVFCADVTGGGDGQIGQSWDYQGCTDLVVNEGLSENSMFPPKEWKLEELTEHCQARFGVTPTPTRLVDQWHFHQDELPQISSHIIFTNGLRDGWSTTSVTENLSPTIRAINFPNGAHHSDLRYAGPSDQDTEDIRLGYQQIEDNLALWLDEIKEGMVN